MTILVENSIIPYPISLFDLLSDSFLCNARQELLDQEEITLDNGNLAGPIVYVQEGEYAIVLPIHADYIGSTAATTCIIVIVKHLASGWIGCAHLTHDDFLQIHAIKKMMEKIKKQTSSHAVGTHTSAVVDWELFMIGAFDQYALLCANGHIIDSMNDDQTKEYHWSSISTALLALLHQSNERISLQLLCVGPVNTQFDSSHDMPIPRVTALFYSINQQRVSSNISLHPSSRGPWQSIRALHVEVCHDEGLICHYQTLNDSFIIKPFTFPSYNRTFLQAVPMISDEQLLQVTSTSPWCEANSFCGDIRSKLEFLARHGIGQQWWSGKEENVQRRDLMWVRGKSKQQSSDRHNVEVDKLNQWIAVPNR